jgi:hypothetical protein
MIAVIHIDRTWSHVHLKEHLTITNASMKHNSHTEVKVASAQRRHLCSSPLLLHRELSPDTG